MNRDVRSLPLLTLRTCRVTARQKYVAAQVLSAMGIVEVEWVKEEDAGNQTSLAVNGKTLCSWTNHDLVEEGCGFEVDVDWGIWVRDVPKKVELMLPCFDVSATAQKAGDRGSMLPFDPLAASFWGMTCWDEQRGAVSLDEHQRPDSRSLPWSRAEGDAAFGDHRLPMRSQHRWPWLDLMWHVVLDGSGLTLTQGVEFRPTFDVDVAFKHLGRSRMKSRLLQWRDALKGNWKLVKERRDVLLGNAEDEYDTYSAIQQLHAQEPLAWFILAAERNRPHDIGLDPGGETLPALVETLGAHRAGARVCWHPSYAAVDRIQVAKDEQGRFASWHGTDLAMVRSHFLRGTPGVHWRNLVELGIEEDASLGWSRDVGFRSGTSRPFEAYDLTSESAMGLTVHPVAVMDTALRVGLQWSPELASKHMDQMMEVVAMVGGTWMSCWHNTSFSDASEWQGWRATYVHMVHKVRQL